jgi:hypothetical protein
MQNGHHTRQYTLHVIDDMGITEEQVLKFPNIQACFDPSTIVLLVDSSLRLGQSGHSHL